MPDMFWAILWRKNLRNLDSPQNIFTITPSPPSSPFIYIFTGSLSLSDLLCARTPNGRLHKENLGQGAKMTLLMFPLRTGCDCNYCKFIRMAPKIEV